MFGKGSNAASAEDNGWGRERMLCGASEPFLTAGLPDLGPLAPTGVALRQGKHECRRNVFIISETNRFQPFQRDQGLLSRTASRRGTAPVKNAIAALCQEEASTGTRAGTFLDDGSSSPSHQPCAAGRQYVLRAWRKRLSLCGCLSSPRAPSSQRPSWLPAPLFCPFKGWHGGKGAESCPSLSRRAVSIQAVREVEVIRGS